MKGKLYLVVAALMLAVGLFGLLEVNEGYEAFKSEMGIVFASR